jgi:hypothetical protein
MANNEKNQPKVVPPKNPMDSHDIETENIGQHEGATEDEVSDTPAPAGPDFDDEPKQG